MYGFRDEAAAIEYVNFVFRHGSPDIALAAVEQTLHTLGDDYRRAFLTSAAAALQRAGIGAVSVAVARPSLDDVYLRYTGRRYAETETETTEHDRGEHETMEASK